MKGGHAHEESALLAVLIVALIGIVDLFVDIADEHPSKLLCYLGIFIIIYSVARIWRNREWK